MGQGSQHCHYDVNLPIGFRDTREQQVEAGVKSATVTNSDLPGLLGLQSLEKMGAVLDLRTGTLYQCGTSDTPLSEGLPPGTLEYKLQKAESGHLMLPCCEYDQTSARSKEDSQALILAAKHKELQEPPAPTYWPKVENPGVDLPPVPAHEAGKRQPL